MSICLTKKELANIAGYTYRRLYDIDKNLPPSEKLFVPGEKGKYELSTFVQRWVDYNINQELGKNQSFEEVKTAHEIVKTKKTELEVARMEGRLVDVQDVQKLWAEIANMVMQNMIRLPSKLAPVLVMVENPQTINSIMDREIRDILIQISETPLPSYAAVFDEADNEETDEDLEEAE